MRDTEETMNTRIEGYRSKGWRDGMRCHPDVRRHYNEPYRTAYGENYDRAVAYRKREGIDFYDAKARMLL